MPGQPSLTRRRLLQAGARATAAALLGRAQPAAAKSESGYGHSTEPGAWQNWSGGQTSHPASYLAPASEEELIRGLEKAPVPIRACGASHSFSPVVASDGTIVTLDGIKGVIAHDATKLQATLWAGTRIRD